MTLQESFSAPLKDKSWPFKVALGTLAWALGFLILPTIAYAGYLIRIVRDNLQADSTVLPEWDDLAGLFKCGLVAWLASLLYMLIPGTLFVVGSGSFFAGAMFGAQTESGAPVAAGAGVGVLLLWLGALLAFLLTFWLPMALLRVAVHGTLASAFEVGPMMCDFGRAPAEYLVIPALSYGGAIVAGGLIGWIPILGPLLVVACGIYINLVQAGMLGRLYRERLGGHSSS